MKLTFLCSSGGGTARAIQALISNRISNIFPKNSKVRIIADRECGATVWAEENNIPFVIKTLNSEDAWNELSTHKWLRDADVIVTTLHKIIPPLILNKFEEKMINVHYSILPSFQGTIGKNTILKSLEYGMKLFGSTCHYVTEEVDGGYPICQTAFANTTKDPNQLEHYCYLCGCLSLVNSIALITKTNERQLVKGLIRFDEIDILINPCHYDTQRIFDYLSVEFKLENA